MHCAREGGMGPPPVAGHWVSANQHRLSTWVGVEHARACEPSGHGRSVREERIVR